MPRPARAPAAPTPRRRRVGIGTQFRSTFQDGNCLWVVVKRRGAGTWDCEIDKSDLDYGGVRRVFGSETILRSIERDAMFQTIRDGNQAFWDNVPVHTTLHYHDGFGVYLRGTVGTLDGKKMMLPHALVGIIGAFKHDLPRRRRADGSVIPFNNADRIINAIPFQPNYTNIFESPAFNNRYPDYDPRLDVPRDLTIPPLEGRAAEIASLWDVRQSVLDALSTERGDQFVAVMLARAAEILKTAGY